MPIEFKKVAYTYKPGTPFASNALQDIDCTIDEGDFVGIIGHTGSGKSTFAQHCNALLHPTAGIVSVDGTDLAEKTPESKNARKKVGLVFQYPEYQLFEETVKQDIAYGPRNMGLSEEEIEKRVIEAAELVGLGKEYLDVSPFELSGGQKRRVAIAGVLAMDPKYLILDEPAAGLDPQGRNEIDKLLRELHAGRNKAIIMISHSMDDAARLCKRVLVMMKGTISLDGTPAEVFKNEDTLLKAGLDIPETVKIAKLFRAQGYTLPEDIFDAAQIARAIAPQIKERRHA